MAFGNFSVGIGKPLPMGAVLTKTGVNFSLFSRGATSVTIAIFESPEPGSAKEEIRLDKHKNRTGDVWHCHVEGLQAGAFYLYRVDGPYIPEKGLRFNPHKSIMDP
jgi:glycogen operon protein